MKSKRGLKINRKAQGALDMSFGMIFSVILIIFFVVVAFIAIKSFLNTQKCAQIGIFKDDFQSEITKLWPYTGDFEFKGRLPSKVKYVCFLDLSKSITATGIEGNIGRELGVYEGEIANMFLYPTESVCDMAAHDIDHLDMDKIISSKNPYCIPVDDGNININLKKDFNERLVSLS